MRFREECFSPRQMKAAMTPRRSESVHFAITGAHEVLHSVPPPPPSASRPRQGSSSSRHLPRPPPITRRQGIVKAATAKTVSAPRWMSTATATADQMRRCQAGLANGVKVGIVRTAKKRTALADDHLHHHGRLGADDPSWGAAKIDGVKGHELLLSTGGGDGATTIAVTWRKGEARPGATAPQPRGTGADKYNCRPPSTPAGERAGYRVYIKKGKRYIQNYWTSTDGLGNWTANITMSKWTKSGWKKVSAKTKAVTAAQVKKSYPGTVHGCEDRLREVPTPGAQITDSTTSGFPKQVGR